MTDDAASLVVGGITPLTSTDYPGALAAVIFCQGCPLRCPYCHNPHLLPRRPGRPVSWQGVLALLERRRGLLDAVVFSGGEPTLQGALPAALRVVRAMGYATGLHTAGVDPHRLRALLPLLDWVGFDVKAPFDEYRRVTGAACGARVRASLAAVLASGVVCEVRTTVDPALITPATLEMLTATLARMGVRRYVLQEARANGRATPAPAITSWLTDEWCERHRQRFESFAVRRAGPCS